MSTITYVNDGVYSEDDAALTLLQVSEKHHIPHMHACGGMARCSTCRVMVLEHPENLTPPTPAELALAQHMGFGNPIRLACQSRVLGPVTVRRLTLDDQDVSLDTSAAPRMPGREQKIAILFSDIRNFTAFAEHSLPYDTVHVLNRYFQAMGEAVLKQDGYIDKYIGDGMMALFGMNCTQGDTNCGNAIKAALEMLRELERLNVYLRRNFNIEFHIGIGIHYGEAVLGEIGHSCRRQITAIGDAVNMASRIESATKQFGAPLLISENVREQLGTQLQLGRTFNALIKGKTGSYALHEVLGLNETVPDNPLRKLKT